MVRPSATAEPARILVVDDEPIIAMDVEQTLRDLGYEVLGTAASPDAARRLAAVSRPDLVLMDVQLGTREDGIDVALGWGGDAPMPVVFMSAYADDVTLARARSAGAYGYLVKPYQERELHATLQMALERARSEARLRELAFRDTASGLASRPFALERLDQALRAAQRHDELVAVLFVDLDGFKPVNDAHGHAAGDVLLRAVADRLRSAVRREDTVARFGGDEFVLVIERLKRREDIELTVHKLVERVAQPVLLPSFGAQPGVAVQVAASVGVAVFPVDAVDAQALLAAADAAMYSAKRAGGGRYRFWQPGMDTTSGDLSLF
jgi:diguanylate cyclase (GGDEF)-like protein